MKHKIKTHGLNKKRRDFVLRCNDWCAEHKDLEFITIEIESENWKEARERLRKFLEVVKNEAINDSGYNG